MEYIDALEADSKTPFAIELMKHPTSMWTAADRLREQFPAQYTLELIPADSLFHHTNLMEQQKLAISRALGYIFYPDARNWAVDNFWDEEGVVDEDVGFVTKKSRLSQLVAIPEAERPIQSSRISSQCQVAPPGAGKSCVALYASLLAGRNALLVTDSRQNEVQMLNSITKHTNVHDYFPVQLIRSNAHEDATEKMVDASLVTHIAPPSEYLNVLEFGSVHGIAIIDVKTFQNLFKSSSDRRRLRTCIFRTNFDIVVIDEADSVAAEEMRLSFLHGVIGEPDDHEVQSSPVKLNGSFRYKLNYNKLIAMSGTWHRGDAAGTRFLNSLGPITYAIKSRDLEDRRLLAKMTVVLVQCVSPCAKVAGMASLYGANALCPEKLRICERIVRFHVSHGQKIMIFSHRHWHLRLLERLFPFALAPSGDTDDDRYAAIEASFKSGVHQAHPLVWITISKGEVGMDVPDTSVVINLVNTGESPSRLRQRMGRASRKKFKYGWFYDLVGINEAEWAPNLAGEGAMSTSDLQTRANRYRLLFKDGYGSDLIRLTSAQLAQRIDHHIIAMQNEGDDDLLIAAEVATKLQKGEFVKHAELLTVDHIVSCAFGSFYSTDLQRRDATLFDTQSQLLVRERDSNRACDATERRAKLQRASHRKKRNDMLPKSQRAPTHSKKRCVSVVAPSAPAASSASSTSLAISAPILLSDADYTANYPISDEIRASPELRATIVGILSSFDASAEFVPQTNDAALLWVAMLALRSRVNTLQYESDRRRSLVCKNVLQLGEGVQEKCSFLHSP